VKEKGAGKEKRHHLWGRKKGGYFRVVYVEKRKKEKKGKRT
jgi:hypothetical protein